MPLHSSSTYSSVSDKYNFKRTNTETVGNVFGNQTTANRVAGEEIFTAPAGHGYAAEAANVQSAALKGIIKGETVKHTGDEIDPATHRMKKNGPDYIVTDRNGRTTEIQSKYYNNPKSTLKACFDESGKFKYFSENGEPMMIEVPADQYDKVLADMKDKICKGDIPDITDPAKAELIVRRGAVTYEQAVNIARFGTIESLIYDAKKSCVSASSALGISAIVTFCTCIWNHDSIDQALQKSLYSGIKVGGNAFITSILVSQASRAGLNKLLKSSSEAAIKAIGPKVAAAIVNSARIGAKAIFGTAAIKNAAKLLRNGTVATGISLTLTLVPDIAEVFRGRISGKQLVKNLAGNVGGIGGGVAGATLGTSIHPGLGTVAGGLVGGIAGSLGVGAISDLLAEDDADEMLDIITEEFQSLAEEYLLNNSEAESVSDALQTKLNATELKNMFAAKDRHIYARHMVEELVINEIRKREPVVIPSDELIEDSLLHILESMFSESDPGFTFM